MNMKTEILPFEIYTKVNMVFGIKEYRQTQKIMTEFDHRLQQEQNKPVGIDHRIK